MIAETEISLKIPGYSIIRALASGGMAEVFLATQENFGRNVALKVMLTQRGDPTFGERFMREARIVAQMSHSNIVSVFDVGEIGGKYYLAMEYLEGGDLQERLKRNADPVFAIDVCRAIASALKYAHDKGFVHRDIKPANVLFRGDCTPVLTDFGIARAVGSNTMLTQQGLVVGTPAYMSPEQALGKPVDNRSDIYSLGILFYQLITGDVPYKSESVISVVMKHIQEPIPRLETHDARLQMLIDKMMAKEPSARYQDCAEVIAALDQLKNAPPQNNSLQNNSLQNNSTNVAALVKADTAAAANATAQRAASMNPQPEKRAVGATLYGIASAILLAVIAWFAFNHFGLLPSSPKAVQIPEAPETSGNQLPDGSVDNVNALAPTPDVAQEPVGTTNANAQLEPRKTDVKSDAKVIVKKQQAPPPAWPLRKTAAPIAKPAPLTEREPDWQRRNDYQVKAVATNPSAPTRPAPNPAWPLAKVPVQKPAVRQQQTNPPAAESAAAQRTESTPPAPAPAWPLSPRQTESLR